MECKNCHKDKNIEEFYTCKTCENGVLGVCNTCRHHSRVKGCSSTDDLLCLECGLIKPQSEFNDCNDYSYRNYKNTKCKSCKKKYKQNWKQADKGRKSLELLIADRAQGVKDNAKRRGLLYDLDSNFLLSLWDKQEGKCAISGLNMTYLRGFGRINTNVSVDRIDSAKGYLKDNVQLVCMFVNYMKQEFSLNELLYFCNEIVKHNNYED